MQSDCHEGAIPYRTSNFKTTNTMKFIKITKGIYGNKETGFYIQKDNSIEGECKWAIQHLYSDKLELYLSQGNDQLFHTLREAKNNLKQQTQ